METVACYNHLAYLFSFKSHHSGMETRSGPAGGGPDEGFKSHHSGMETGGPDVAGPPGDPPLNRTIVGWKLVPWRAGNP